MTTRQQASRLVALGTCVSLSLTGCAFHGLNSLPLPGAVGRGSGAVYHIEIANVATLEANSPVMINDVVVGSVSAMTVKGWHADVDVAIEPGVIVPSNVVASVGQTSLLGSMHVALDPPLGEPPRGQLQPGSTIALNRSSTYPSTERTLSSISAVVNDGALGQIGDIIHNFNIALSGNEPAIRELLTRVNDFVGVLDAQRERMVASVEALNRLTSVFAGQREVLDRALKRIPPALDVLIKERPRIVAALEKLGTFSATTTRLVNDTQVDLVRNLQNLKPTLKALADVGPDLDLALATTTAFPYSQGFIDRAIKGDYANLFAIMDFTVPRLKRGLFLGTRWGQEGALAVPAPGDPAYLNYTYDPFGAPLAAETTPPAAAPDGGAPSAPPASATPAQPGGPVFAGPYSANDQPAVPQLPDGAH